MKNRERPRIWLAVKPAARSREIEMSCWAYTKKDAEAACGRLEERFPGRAIVGICHFSTKKARPRLVWNGRRLVAGGAGGGRA